MRSAQREPTLLNAVRLSMVPASLYSNSVILFAESVLLLLGCHAHRLGTTWQSRFLPFCLYICHLFTNKNGEVYIYPYTFRATIQVQESENCRSYLCYFYYLLLQKGWLMIFFFYSFNRC